MKKLIDILDEIPEIEGNYIFYLKRIAKFYVGETVNLKKRIIEHLNMSNQPLIAQEYKYYPETVKLTYTLYPGSSKDNRLDLEESHKTLLTNLYGWSNLLNLVEGREDFYIRKPIVQLTQSGAYLKSYESIIEVERRTGFSRSNIHKSCTENVYRYNYLWMYEKDYSPLKAKIKSLKCQESPNVKKIVHAFDKETGEYCFSFKSLNQAARILNISSVSNISACIKGKSKTAGGYVWLTEEQLKERPKINLMKEGRIGKYNRKTGDLLDRYDNLTEAANDTNTYPSNIVKVLQNNNYTCGGYDWRYIDDI